MAENNENLYFKAEMRKEMEITHKANLLQLQSRYYRFQAEMPEGDGEQCKFCHRYSAYCEQMRQTRAADEPMTRFMVCFSCKKTWSD